MVIDGNRGNKMITMGIGLVMMITYLNSLQTVYSDIN